MDDPERAFVPFSPSDDYVLVNNLGGTSTLELYAIANETLLQLSKFPPFPLQFRSFLTNFIRVQPPSLA